MENNTLDCYKLGDYAVICGIDAPFHLKRRLLDLGFTRGAVVKIINISPLKNSFLLEIHGYIIALRKNAVHSIRVKENE